MLAYALAIAVGLSSSILFLTAFLMPDVHRRDDFFWSAIGAIYALVLWFCATRITGAVLLGQSAAVALLVSYQWQTLKLRKAIAFPEKAAELDNFSVLSAINNLFSRRSVKTSVQPSVNLSEQPKVTEEKIEIPETTTETIAEADKPSTEAAPSREEVIDEAIAVEKQSIPQVEVEPTPTADTEAVSKPITTPTSPEIKEASAPLEAASSQNAPATESLQTPETKRTGFFGKLFGKKKKATPKPAIESQVNDILEDDFTDERSETIEEEPTDFATTPVNEPEVTTDSFIETETATESDTEDLYTTEEPTSVTDSEPVEETIAIEEEPELTVEAVKVTYTPEENTDTELKETVEVAVEETSEVETEAATENISPVETDSQTKSESIDPVEPSEIKTETDLVTEDKPKVEATDTTNSENNETVENSAPQTDESTEAKNQPDSLNADDTESSQK
ncbi:Ycf66 family protein [Myxosarcina sp. GI1]|uniref:Ycf66 family protein n=1 Tax=Myxosarcina sp. GI1 TaxID=1541065 RepID=UPI00068DF021|nr:Ycf66 family protein [Myxosarcina sp. GI1]